MARDWTEYRIGDIAEIVGGSTPSTADATNFNGDIPWLTPKGLSGQHERYVSRGERNLSQRGLASCSAKLLPAGAVLLSSRAPIGYVAIARNPIATNQGFRSLILKSGFEPEFVYYWLKANVNNLERHASGSTFRELSGSALAEIKIQIPGEATQRAIAHILGSLDDKIELNRRINETLEAISRAIFKSWFVDFDPVIDNALLAGNPIPSALAEKAARRREMLASAKAEGREVGLPKHIADLFPDRFVDSELGAIPGGWRVVSLPEMIDINPPRALRKGDKAPYLDMANMPTRGHTPDAIIERPFGSGMRFINGDTLVARITPCLENGKTAYVDFLADGQVGWGSTEYIVLCPKPPLPSEFGYCFARSTEFREFAIQSMTGTSGRQRVPPEALSHYLLAAPPEGVAKLFGKFVRPLLLLTRSAANESRTLAAVRDTLLPKLISGELSLKNTTEFLTKPL
jgi:type I restriction enzyme S subunit